MARSQSPYLLFSLQSVPKTEIDTGVPHRHTVKSLLKENKEPFHKEASGAFFRFLKDHEVAVLVAHNGKRYVRPFLRFASVGWHLYLTLHAFTTGPPHFGVPRIQPACWNKSRR